MSGLGVSVRSSAVDGVRLRTLRIDAAALLAMLKTHLPTVVHFEGLPEDTKAVDVYPDPRTNDVVLVVWSSEFEAVDPSLPDLPECDVTAATLVLGPGEI